MFADVVTQQEALQKAKQFMPDKSFKQQQRNASQAPLRGNQTESSTYYVFNADNNDGFVIVSADDRTEAILGYADNGNFDKDNMPSNVKAWFDYYEQSIRSLGDAPVRTAPQRPQYAPIEPLITTMWDQDKPYNLQCPMDGSNLSVTGCVATALAQVMYYHKWPASTTEEISSYTTTSKNIQVQALPATTFKWDLMRNEYKGNAVGDTANAVAELMRYCGQILKMDYSSDASGTNLAPYIENLYNYFNYSLNMHYTTREYYSSSQWEEMIYQEIAHNRPVLYDGNAPDANMGHQFICDGYDNNGLFHINWGWGGYCDGYFLLSILNPDGRGIGGGSSADGFSDGQGILLGFAPPTAQEKLIPQIEGYGVGVNTTNYQRASTDLDFTTINLKGNIWFYYEITPKNVFETETGWALYKNGVFVKCLGYETRTVSASNDSYQSNNMTISFGANLEDGEYRIYQVYRLVGDTEWILCKNSIKECITAVIAGNSMTMQKINYSHNLQLNSISTVNYPEKNWPVYLNLNLTNIGETHKQTITLRVSRKGLMGYKDYSSLTYIDPGETDDITASFTPTNTGIYRVQIIGINTDTIYEVTVNEAGPEFETKDLTTSIEPTVNVPFTFTLKYRYTKDIGQYLDMYTLYLWAKAENEADWTNIIRLYFDEYADFTTYETESVTLNTLGAYSIKITDDSQGENVIDTYNINVYETEREVIDGVIYACYPESHKAIIIGSDNTLVPENIVIPSTISHSGTDYSVTVINDEALISKDFAFLKISEGITTIRQCAFNGCQIITLDLPSTLTNIGSGAFDACPNLKYVNARLENPFAMTGPIFKIYSYVPGEAIHEQPSPATLCVPVGTLNKYENLSGWDQFTHYNEGFFDMKTIDGIDYVCLSNADTATIVHAYKDNLPQVLTIPSTISLNSNEYSVRSIQDDVFKNNSTIFYLKISEGIKSIGNNTFRSCSNLTFVDLPSTLTSIGEYAFYDIYQLSYVNAGMQNPFAITDNVFKYYYSSGGGGTGGWWGSGSGEVTNTSRVTLCVPVGTLNNYKNTAGWDMFVNFYEGSVHQTTIDKTTYLYYSPAAEAKMIMIDSDTTATSLTIPASITVNNQQYAVTAIDIDETTFNTNPQNNTVNTLTIPEGVTSISDKAFSKYVGIQNVVLPSTLTSIGENIVDGYYLTTVTTYIATPYAISTKTFGSVTTNAVLYVPKGSVSLYQNTDGWKNFSSIKEMTSEEDMNKTTINGLKYKFDTASKTATIIEATENTNSAIPSTITISGTRYSVIGIEADAFNSFLKYAYTGKDLVIPEGIKEIGNSAFVDCDIETIDLPSSLQSIGQFAFNNVSSKITTVTVRAENPPVVGNQAFYTTNAYSQQVMATIDLYVPAGTVSKYQAASGWNEFRIITDAVTAKAKSYTIEYGQSLPSFDYSLTGAPLSGTPTITCPATNNSPVGTYTISIGKGSVTNSSFNVTNGTLTIKKAKLTVTAESYTIKQGEPLPEFEITFSGFITGEDTTVLTKVPVISTTATSASGPGEYDIIVSGGSAQNYSFSYVKGKLTIQANETEVSDISNESSVSIYTVSGTLLYNDVNLQDVYDQMPSGIYIIRQRDQSPRKFIKK